MTLVTWIEKTGPKNLAKKMRVDPSTICNWKLSKSWPDPKRLLQINKMSGGKVTIVSMVHHFAKRKKRN